MAQIKTTYDGSLGAGGFALDSLADPKSAYRHFDDFTLNLVPHVLANAADGGDTQTLDAYTIVQLSGNSTYPGASTAGGHAGGTMRFTTHTGADDGMIMYPTGLKTEAPNSYDVAYEVRVAMVDVTNSNFFFGLSEAVATGDIISGGAIVAAGNGKDRIGWFSDDSTDADKAQVWNSFGALGGEVATMFGPGLANARISDATMVRFGITVTGGTIRFFFDGELKHTVENSSQVSDQKLIPVLHLTTANAAAEIFDVDYIDVNGVRS
tara:strand:- start:6041 stop:6838 length:798 start_codon:yes stop_codon:yes gene_type:complete